MKKFFANLTFISICIITSVSSLAASVDTINIYSNAMKKNIKCVVILPESYKIKNNIYPVVYLLHGYAGDYADWITKVPQIKNYADEFQEMIVCPDGHFNSWYFDSPVDSTIKYETYISYEVPHYIDSAYKTIAERKGRAICGLSMGGHGAFFIAWKHSDTFGAAGSMSGVLDLSHFKTEYEMVNVLGDTLQNQGSWKNHSVINVVDEKTLQMLQLIFDCGVNDRFIEANRQLHKKLLSLKIAHDYIERPGTHNWQYWANAIRYQLLFFSNFFKAS